MNSVYKGGEPEPPAQSMCDSNRKTVRRTFYSINCDPLKVSKVGCGLTVLISL